jgi:hypothetical protein
MAEVLHIVISLRSGDGMTKQGHGREDKRVLAKLAIFTLSTNHAVKGIT